MALDSGPTGSPSYTMYLDQSAHLDWDWLCAFAQYYDQPCPNTQMCVRDLLNDALGKLADPEYHYSICEMGFLRAFVEDDPTGSRRDELEQAGDRFQVIGGGIVSPDCLVSSGEGFIRNYLVGRLALANTLPTVTPKPYCVIPDDFGQGPELPVLLQALGFPAVVFSRLPGQSPYGPTDPALRTT
jgi:alpha-mannosidase